MIPFICICFGGNKIFNDIIAAIFGGGATGLLGSFIGKIFDYFHTKAEYAHRERMAEVEMQHLKMEIERDVVVARAEAMAKMEEAAAKTQAASYAADKRAYLPSSAISGGDRGIIWLMALVDFIRGLIRPALTLFLSVVAWLIYRQTAVILETAGRNITPQQAYDLNRTVTLGLLYLAFTAVGWWFGSRTQINKILSGGKDVISTKI